MATQFEFRLIGAAAPEGELEADQLIAIVQSLKDVAVKLSRVQAGADQVGRPPKRAQQVARLTVGLAPGSTRVLVRRSDVDENALPIELREEHAFDEDFEKIIASIARNERPSWVPDTLARAAGGLRAALEAAAPTVEFTVGGDVRQTFRTERTHKETWKVAEPVQAAEPKAFVGRLRAVNLDTHRLQVTDDVGTKVALPNVVNDAEAGRLLGDYVEVVGTPEFDAAGKLSQMLDVVVRPAPPLTAELSPGVREPVSLEDILASAPGARPGGIPGLTTDEAESFMRAIGL